MEYIDIHSHLYFPEFEADREKVIDEMKAEKIATITVGTDLGTSHQAVSLANEHEHLYATVGVHPKHDLVGEKFKAHDFEAFMEHPKVVAIGECGLDYGKTGEIDKKEKKEQVKLFEQQIELAAKHDKPLMIHCRNAYDDLLDILEEKKKEHGDKLRTHMHFFAGTQEVLKRCLDNDFTVSFTGVVTFAASYRELVVYTPLSKIMAETDAPFVSPEPFRGSRNDPRRIKEIVQAIARIREEDLEEVKKALRDNAISVFRLAKA